MTYLDNITTNDILTLRLQANSGAISTEKFVGVLDAYEDALSTIEESEEKQDDLERKVKTLERTAEKADEEITQLENQATLLQEATKRQRKG